ncbi:MAG: metal ABC transporter substrate-binding protein [Chloroflexota bacterium]
MRGLRLLLPCVLFLAACGTGSGTVPSSLVPGAGIAVVTTSSVFADLVRNVGGSRVSVTSLVPRGADVHTYQPTPADLRAVAGAKLFFMNGLGLDDWLEKTIQSASNGAPIVKLGEGLPGVTLLAGDSPTTQNPHLWMDVANAALYAERIATSLKAADPGHAPDIDASAAAFAGTLADLDAWVRGQIETIPPANRQFVTFHDALPYFAKAYGLTVVGVAVEAPGQDPSAGEIAALIDAIRRSGVHAIFSEAQFPTTLIDQIARETGAVVVSNLYDDTLGDDPITSYEAMIRWDVEQLVGALR